MPVARIGGLPIDAVDGAIAGRNALAVRRFDRTRGGGRIHTEDFAQVFGLYPERKYQRFGYGDIGRVLGAFSNSDAIDQFARRLIYSAMVGNADMHLKNWSLIYRDGKTPEIAPAYDLLCTVAHLPDNAMALRLARAKAWDELTLDRFARLASRMDVSREAVLGPVVETIDRFRQVWASEARHLPVSGSVAAGINRQLACVPAVARMRSREPASSTTA